MLWISLIEENLELQGKLLVCLNQDFLDIVYPKQITEISWILRFV